jgi:hypothetical protein
MPTSPHTKKFCPWELLAYFAFKSKAIAAAFEKYLKSGSGRAFVKRHFRSDYAEPIKTAPRNEKSRC